MLRMSSVSVERSLWVLSESAQVFHSVQFISIDAIVQSTRSATTASVQESLQFIISIIISARLSTCFEHSENGISGNGISCVESKPHARKSQLLGKKIMRANYCNDNSFTLRNRISCAFRESIQGALWSNCQMEAVFPATDAFPRQSQ